MPFFWHFHRGYELTLMIESRGNRFVGDDISPYEAGDLLLIGPALPHTWSADPSYQGRHECAVVHFGVEVIPGAQLDALGAGDLSALLRHSERGLAFGPEIARRIQPLMEAMPGARPLQQLARLYECLDVLSATKAVRTVSKTTFRNQLSEEDVTAADRICRYVQQSLTKPLSVAAVASHAAMSVSAFSRFFKRATGQTFVAYVTELRVRQACRLLTDTDRSIADVAAQAGFDSLANFNRRFRRSQGLTPRDFRRKHARP